MAFFSEAEDTHNVGQDQVEGEHFRKKGDG